MTDRNVALVDVDGYITNLIVVDEHTPPGFLDKLVDADDRLDRHVDADGGADTIGNVELAGRGYVPPFELDVTDTGVTITDNRPTPASELTAEVAGKPVTVRLVNRVGTIPVGASTTADPVVVAVPEAGLAVPFDADPPPR